MASDLVERWPGYDEQSWQERFEVLDKLHRERTEEVSAIVVKMAHEIERLRKGDDRVIDALVHASMPLDFERRYTVKGDGEREAIALVFYDASDPARNVANLADALENGNGRVSIIGWRKLIGDLNAALTTPNDTPVRGLAHVRELGWNRVEALGETPESNALVAFLNVASDETIAALTSKQTVSQEAFDAAKDWHDNGGAEQMRDDVKRRPYAEFRAEVMAGQTVSVDREAEFVALVSRMTMPGDEDWSGSEADNDQDALWRLIAKAREIRCAPPLDGESAK